MAPPRTAREVAWEATSRGEGAQLPTSRERLTFLGAGTLELLPPLRFSDDEDDAAALPDAAADALPDLEVRRRDIVSVKNKTPPRIKT